MVSEKFRHQLRQEANQWRSEGHINQEFYDYLTQQYQFNQLDTDDRNRFVMVLIGLGSVLLGLAVITFVAANWQVWTKEFKVTLLLVVFIAVNSLGFYLWQYTRFSRLGQGFLLLGSLILGANMALMSQMFHLSGPIYQLYLIWGFGVLAMAYGLRLTLLGILTVILWSVALWTGFIDYYQLSDQSLWQILLEHLPLVGAVSLIPLAYWCESRWLFGLSTVLITVSFVSNYQWGIIELFRAENYWSSAVLLAIVCVLPPLCLWGYPGLSRRFEPITQNLAVLFLSIWFFFASFGFFWDDYQPELTELVPWDAGILLIDLFLLTGITFYAWYKLGFVESSTWRVNLTDTVIAGMTIIAGVTIWWDLQMTPLVVLAPIIFNSLLLLLAIGLLREALGTGKRKCFWFGVLLLVGQVFARTIEYDTGLLTKAVILGCCGIGVILAGLWFERNVRTVNN